MPAYFVFTREETSNQSDMDTYGSLVGATFDGHPVKTLTAYGPQTVLEGPEPEGVAILEFPTREDALAWYRGLEYQAIVKHRWKGSSYRAVLVEG
jgi:uncharacterized protein (DUF1330 family)